MDRRTCFKWMTNGLGAMFTALIGIPGVSYLIDPRNRPAPAGAFRRVARLSDLKVGIPHQAVVNNIRRDAWTLHPNDVIGRVWLIRRSDDTVDAYTTICPHLGGSINFDAANRCFVCPLHGAAYDLTCQRLLVPGKSNPAPRGMDKLESQLVDAPGGKDGTKDYFIEVKYQNFIQGREEQVLKA